MRPFGKTDYLFSESRRRPYGVYTAALRWVIVAGVVLALYLFGIVSSAF